jgi:hypothetical protein
VGRVCLAGGSGGLFLKIICTLVGVECRVESTETRVYIGWSLLLFKYVQQSLMKIRLTVDLLMVPGEEIVIVIS